MTHCLKDQMSNIQGYLQLMVHEKREIIHLIDETCQAITNFYVQKYILSNKKICLRYSTDFVENLDILNYNNDQQMEQLISITTKTFSEEEISIFTSLFQHLKENINFTAEMFVIINNSNKEDNKYYLKILITCLFGATIDVDDVEWVSKFVGKGFSEHIFDLNESKDEQNEPLQTFMDLLSLCTPGMYTFYKAALDTLFCQLSAENSLFYNFSLLLDQNRIPPQLSKNQSLKIIINYFNTFLAELNTLLDILPLQILNLIRFLKSYRLFLQDTDSNPLFFRLWRFFFKSVLNYPSQFGVPCTLFNQNTTCNIKTSILIFDDFILLNFNELCQKYGRENIEEIDTIKIKRIEHALSIFGGLKDEILSDFESSISRIFVISESQLIQLVSWIHLAELKNKELKEIMKKIEFILHKLKPQENKVKKIGGKILSKQQNFSRSQIYVFKSSKPAELKKMELLVGQSKSKICENKSEEMLFNFPDDQGSDGLLLDDWWCEKSIPQKPFDIIDNNLMDDIFGDNLTYGNSNQNKNLYPSKNTNFLLCNQNEFDFSTEIDSLLTINPPIPATNNTNQLHSNINNQNDLSSIDLLGLMPVMMSPMTSHIAITSSKGQEENINVKKFAKSFGRENNWALFSNLELNIVDNGNFVDLAGKLASMCSKLSTLANQTKLENYLAGNREMMKIVKINTVWAYLEDNLAGFTQYCETIKLLHLVDEQNISLIQNHLVEISSLYEQYIQYLSHKKRETIQNLNFFKNLTKINKIQQEYCGLNILSSIYNLYFTEQPVLFHGFLDDFMSSDFENQTGLIRSTIDKFKPLSSHKILKNLPNELLALTSILPEQIVFGWVYTAAMFPRNCSTSEDEQIRQKIRALSDDVILVPELKEMKECPWFLAERELLYINCYKTPRDKIKCVVKMARIISAILSMGNHSTSADMLFPALIYVVCKANPLHLLTNVNYINSFLIGYLAGEDNYCWTQFSMAVSYITQSIVK